MTEPIGADSTKISVVIALRAIDGINVLQRLFWKDVSPTGVLEVIVVDDGSANPGPVQTLAQSRGWRYVYLQTADALFSLSRARNAGIRAALGTHVYFEDVDMLHTSDFYARLHEVASELSATPFNFAAVPTLFLTEQSSERLVNALPDREEFDLVFRSFVRALPFVNPDEPNYLCNSFAPVGSNILVARDTCFHVGLFDEYFNAWGGEDRDFVYRLILHNQYLPKPRRFEETKKWAIHRTNEFEGWRAVYRLHGDWLKSSGLYAVHIYHPDNSWKEPETRQANFAYAESKALALARGTRRMQAVPFGSGPPNVFIGRNPVFYNDEVMSVLGSVKILDPDPKVAPDVFAESVLELKPARVFFQNPYGNVWLLDLWTKLRTQGVTCICAERGALPGSIYFDGDGFCADSGSYKRARWEHASPVDAAAYLRDVRAAGVSLEPQGKRPIGSVHEAIDSKKRTVLVLLQSLTDATTLRFTSPLRDYAHFLDIARELTTCDSFNVLVKNHPLNNVNPLQGYGISVDDVPIYDLLDLADSVVTLNSGAGVLALAAGAQVINLGTSFYAQAGLAESCASFDDLLSALKSDRKPTVSDVDRFYGYLINEFYSFAEWMYGSRSQSQATLMSTMRAIRYSKIAIGDVRKTIYRSMLSTYSLIMDPFALDQVQERRKATKVPKSLARERVWIRVLPLFMSSRKRKKFQEDPAAFYRDAKNPLGKLIGRMVLGGTERVG